MPIGKPTMINRLAYWHVFVLYTMQKLYFRSRLRADFAQIFFDASIIADLFSIAMFFLFSIFSLILFLEIANCHNYCNTVKVLKLSKLPVSQQHFAYICLKCVALYNKKGGYPLLQGQPPFVYLTFEAPVPMSQQLKLTVL